MCESWFLCPFADVGSGNQGHCASVAFFNLEMKLERNFSVEDNVKVDLYLKVSRDSYGRMSTKVHPHRVSTVFIGFRKLA